MWCLKRLGVFRSARCGGGRLRRSILVAILIVILVGSRGAPTKMTTKTTTRTVLAKRKQVPMPQDANLFRPCGRKSLRGR